MKKSIVYLMIGAICIAIGPFFVEFSEVDIWVNTFYRLLIGSVFFVSLSIIKGEIKGSRSILIGATLASLALILDLALWNGSILSVGSGLSTVLGNLEIIFLMLMGRVFFKERYEKRFLYALGVICIGLYLLIAPYLRSGDLMGIVMGIGSAFFYSLYLMTIKRITKENSQVSSIGLLAWICLIGTVFLGILMKCAHISFVIPNGYSFYCVSMNAIFSQIIGWLFITSAVRKIPLSLSGVILLIQPALTFLADGLFLGRNTSIFQIIGCILILSSIAIILRKETKMSC